MTATVAACAAFTAVVPLPKNHRTARGHIYGVLNFIALNIAHGKAAAKAAADKPNAQPTSRLER